MRGKFHDHHQSLSPSAGSQQIDDVLVLAKVDQNLEFWGQVLVLCSRSTLWKGKGKLKRLGDKEIDERKVLLASNRKRKFENQGSTLKTHQTLSVHTTVEGFENGAITSHFAFAFDENASTEISWPPYPRHFRKASFLKFFCHAKTQSLSRRLNSVFKKIRFRDRLVWTVGLTRERKLLFKLWIINVVLAFCAVTSSFLHLQ